MTRTFVATAAGLALCGSLGSSNAAAWTDETSGSWAVATSGGTASLFSAPTTDEHVAVTIGVTEGSVEIQRSTDDTSWATILAVASGDRVVVEGTYARLRVRATAASSGSFRVRHHSGYDWDLGILSDFRPGSVRKRVYFSEAATSRHLRVTAALNGSVSVFAASSGGAALITIDGGDVGCVRITTAEYWLEGSGQPFLEVDEPNSRYWSPWQKFGRQMTEDREDTIYDPDDRVSEHHEFQFKNTGVGPVKAVYRYSGEGEASTAVDPGDELVLSGRTEYVRIKYPDSKVSGAQRGEWRHRRSP